MPFSQAEIPSRQKLTWLITWFIWPLGALILSLRNQNRNTLFFVLWLFCIFYGWMFIVPEDVIGAADSARYGRELKFMYEHHLSFTEFIQTLYVSGSNNLDIYQPTLTWIVAYFIDNPRWLFMVFATVFGYFYVRNLSIVASLVPRFNLLIILFFLGLMMVNPIWNINGARMYTAANVFILGLLLYFFSDKSKSYYYLIASIFFHFSFTFPLVVFLIWKFMPKWVGIYFGLFIGTAFLQEINFEFVREALMLLPDIFQGKVSSYYGEEYLDNFESGPDNQAIHVRLYSLLRKVFLYSWIIAIYFYWHTRRGLSPSILPVVSFILFFGAVSNITSMLPSGGRFLVIVEFLLFIPIFYVLDKSKSNTFIFVSKFITGMVLVYLIIFNLRVGLDYVGIAIVISNPVLGYFFENQVPIIETIKDIFTR